MATRKSNIICADNLLLLTNDALYIGLREQEYPTCINLAQLK